MASKLRKGILIPNGEQAKVRGKVLNVRSQKREEPKIYSRLDGLLKGKKPKICIYRRLGGIGDVIMSTPLLKHIKKLVPNCHLVYATDLVYSKGALGDVVRNNPFIDEICSYKTVTARDFDLFADITATGLAREKKGIVPPNRIDMFGEQLGIDVSSDPVPTLVVTNDEQEWAKKLIKEQCLPHNREEVTVVGLQVKSNDNRRSWPLEHNKELVKLLTKDPKVRVALFHWQKKTQFEPQQTFICDYNQRYTTAIADQCDVIVCPDSSMLHVAGALQKKTVSLFGSVPPESRMNHYANCTAITAGLPCEGCWYSPSCGGKITCMKEITPKMVQDAIKIKLTEKTKVQKVISVNSKKGFSPDNIVLVKRHHGGFGDIVQSMTAVEALKEKYPTKRLYYALPKKYWPAAENSPVIDKLLDADKEIRNNRYSIVYDISSPCANYEANKVRRRKLVDKTRVEIFSEALGVSNLIKDKTGTYHPTKEELAWAKDFLPETDRPRLAVVMHCAEQYRNWPIDKYNDLIPLLTNKFQVVIAHHIRDYSYPNTIDGCGFPFRKNAALILNSDLVLTPDTAALHIAGSAGIPTVTMFGPIDPRARCKYNKDCTVVTANMSCVPCWRNQNMPCKISGTPKGYSRCMENLAVKDVFEALVKKVS